MTGEKMSHALQQQGTQTQPQDEAVEAQAKPTTAVNASADAAAGHEPSAEDTTAYLRTEFLQRLAHDLRGHAGVIHGALQELEASLGEQASGGALFFGMAKRGVKRILRTADRLQQTGQIERGSLSISKAECDVRELVKEAASEAHGVEGRKKINVELDLPGHLVSSSADAHWLSAALIELLTNAIRHAQARVRVTVSADAETVSIEVMDDGRPGEPFGPARFRPPRDRRGLGLGLSIVHDVATAHGGGLSIELGSEDRQRPFGAKVTLTLPKR